MKVQAHAYNAEKAVVFFQVTTGIEVSRTREIETDYFLARKRFKEIAFFHVPLNETIVI